MENKISLHEFIKANYSKTSKKKFTVKEKSLLRPIAETLAMMDGNAFFGISIDEFGEDTWYEQYLPEAYIIFKANGGLKGWASETSWVKDSNHENETVKEAYNQWQLLKILAKKQQ